MSADEFTPTIERVRDLFSWAYAWRTQDDPDDGETDLSHLRERQRAEFDRALAEHDAKVAAKVLEDARAEIMKWHRPGDHISAHVERAHILRFIENRAAAIRGEADRG